MISNGMQEPLVSNSARTDAAAPTEVAEFVTRDNARVQRGLCLDGISDARGETLVLPFKDVIGVQREGARLVYVSYPRVVGPSVVSCCVNGEEKRERTETEFVCSDEETAKRWEDASWAILLKDFVKRKGRHNRRFLVFLNPRSGKGLSESIFQNHTLPMFRDAGVECTVIKTEYSGHAYKICKDTVDLASLYDGVLIVSGDGLLFEVIQGVMTRPDWADVVRNTALGVIPGGSGNGLAVSLSHAHGEKRSPLSNSFLIAKGLISPLDLCAVDHAKKGRMYSFLSLEYGFMADIDIGSEWMRSLGEIRFTIAAILNLFNPQSSKCRLSYLPVDGSTTSPSKAPSISNYWDDPDAYAGQDGPQCSLCPPLSSTVPSNWKTVEDRFYFMWHANVAWMSSNTMVAPHSRWNDGYVQLSFYRKSKSRFARWNIGRYLLSLETGAQLTDEGKSRYKAVEMFPTRAFRLEPHTNSKVRIAIDGESVELAAIQMEVLPGIAQLMGASPEM